MTQEEKIKQLKQSLKVAADALSIANDWNVSEMELELPPEWNLDNEGLEEGWCSTNELSRKLRQLSN